MMGVPEKKLLMLRPEEIAPSPNQPRKSFDGYQLKLLADSIAASGILQPLAVRKRGDGVYELIAGERRLKAAVMAGLKRVPCILHKADGETAALLTVLENLQRSDLTAFEEAEGIRRLITEYGMPQSEAAERLGIAQSTLSNKLRLLRLDEPIRERLLSAGLTERHARALLRIPEEQREEALDRILAEGMTLRQTEEYISALLLPPTPKKTEPVRKAAIGDVRLFSNSLSKLVTTLQNAGIEADSKRQESEEFIEFQVRIRKNAAKIEKGTQLKIC